MKREAKRKSFIPWTNLDFPFFKKNFYFFLFFILFLFFIDFPFLNAMILSAEKAE